MRRLITIAIGLATTACRPDALTAPVLSNPAPGMTRAEYIDACHHRPGAKMRLYGCSAWVYAGNPQPLFVIDGRPLPAGTGWWQRRRRERALRAIRPDAIREIVVVAPSDTARLAEYGPDGRHGVVLISMESTRAQRDQEGR